MPSCPYRQPTVFAHSNPGRKSGNTSSPASLLLALLLLAALAGGPASGQTICPLTPVTNTITCGSVFPSVDGSAVAFESTCDLTGGNPDGSQEIFLFDGATTVQVTATAGGCNNLQPSLSGGEVAFVSTCDHTGGNPGGQIELFLFDGSTITQVTSLGGVFNPSLDASGIAFSSAADHAGNNADANVEIFLFDGVTIDQVTTSTACQNGEPSLEGGAVAFRSDCDLTGGNPDGNIEVFLFDGANVLQVTDTSGCGTPTFFSPGSVDLDGGVVAFGTSCDLAGGNADGNSEIFLFDGTTFTQRTSTSGCFNFGPRLDGNVAAFQSDCTADGSTHVLVSDGVTSVDSTPAAGCNSSFYDLGGGTLAVASACNTTGGNPDGNPELLLGACRGAAVVEIPAAGRYGLAALALLLGAVALFALRRAV